MTFQTLQNRRESNTLQEINETMNSNSRYTQTLVLQQTASRNRRHCGSQSCFVVVVLLATIASNGLTALCETKVGGPVARNTIWTFANSPFRAAQNVEVPVGGTLSIEPGVEVQFDACGLIVAGTLIARGTLALPIRFTTVSETPEPGQWQGIKFGSSCLGAKLDASGKYEAGSILEHAIVEHSTGILIESCDPLVTHCHIKDNMNSMGGGFLVWKSNATISHNRIERNVADHTGGGIRIVGGTPTIADNFVGFNRAKSSGGGISSDFSAPRIIRNTIVHNSAWEGGGISTGAPSMGEGYLSGNAGSSPLIVDNQVCHNFASSSGGGIHVAGTPTITGNLVACNVLGYANEQVNEQKKDDPEDSPSDAEIRCRFVGAGIYVEGTYGGQAIIEKNRVLANTGACWGGGLCVVRGSAMIRDNQFLGNQAELSGGGMSIVLVTPSQTIGSRPHGSNIEISRNWIKGNLGNGLELAGAGRQNLKVESCVLDENGPYDVDNKMRVPVVLQHCRLKAEDSGDRVFDFFDNSRLGKVHFEGMLKAESAAKMTILQDDLKQWLTAPQKLRGGPSLVAADQVGSAVGLTWEPPPEFEVEGYRIYFDLENASRGSGVINGKSSPIDVGNINRSQIAGTEAGKCMFFAVTAYDAQGQETAFSEPVRVCFNQ